MIVLPLGLYCQRQPCAEDRGRQEAGDLEIVDDNKRRVGTEGVGGAGQVFPVTEAVGQEGKADQEEEGVGPGMRSSFRTSKPHF